MTLRREQRDLDVKLMSVSVIQLLASGRWYIIYVAVLIYLCCFQVADS